MKFFDSHAHYWDQRFLHETDRGPEALLSSLFLESVSGVVNVGTDLLTTKLAIEQAKKFPCMYSAGGIHPSDIPDTMAPEDFESLFLPLFQDKENKLLALGEIGLDYHFEPFSKERQWLFLETQMSFAQKYRLPVIIHDREAHGDLMDMVRRFPDVKGVFHSYSGSVEMAKELVRRGYMISFSGTVSFKNARVVKEVAASLPHDAVMIETDAPYLAPHPHRGKLNHSGYLAYTAGALSELWQMPIDAVAKVTEENAHRFFNITF